MDIKLKYNGTFDIATGGSRKETHWRNKEILWSEFLKEISVTHYTTETSAEYAAMKKTLQDDRKDRGGFVGGYVNNGRRKSENITHRQLIALDADAGKPGLWEDFILLYDCAAAVYSTHKHTPINPRLRLIIPLDRPVSAEEYVAISRRLTNDSDIERFDITTYEPSRLMYWPTTSKGAEYVFKYQDGPWLSADAVLATYRNWKDASEWPKAEKESEVIHRGIKKQGDPLEKPGIIGAFCREYDIHEAIETFLADVYEACDVPDRYTFIQGTTGAGLVVYDNKYTFSHHGTDPTSGKLCNAFDLVRIHMFGLKDEDVAEGTASKKLPSFTAMVDYASQNGKVRKRLGSERKQEIKEDFANGYQAEEVKDETWLEEMDTDRKGIYRSTTSNIRLVLDNDEELKGKLAKNRFENREIATADLPWRTIIPQTKYLTDTDDAGIRHYLETYYGITGSQKVQDAVLLTLSKNSFHPVLEYLRALVWDGEKRLDTLLINYLGAKDCNYIKAVTRKTLVAAVARVFQPGCKFDYITVLIGKQGIGKSTLVKRLGGPWYSDSFSGVQGKEAYEQIQGVWILEMAELAGLKKAEMEQTKHFISKPEDRYRVAYGKRTENFPRQCIFIGTTNTKDFLSDPTGNRRFWPVDTGILTPTKNIFEDLTETVLDQIWAEAVTLYKAGEKLFLSAELEAIARDIQTEHSEVDDRAGIIQKYLDTRVPDDWKQRDIYQRREFLQGGELAEKGTTLRKDVSVAEIWCELFNKPQVDMSRFNTKEIHNILKSIPGWESVNAPSMRPIYGVQRIYRRVIATYTNQKTTYTNSKTAYTK